MPSWMSSCVLLVCSSVVFLTACGGRERFVNDELLSGTLEQEGVLTAAAPSAQPKQESLSSPKSTFSAASLLSGLEELDSYRLETVMEFDGLGADGQPERWQISSVSIVDSGPPARSVDIITQGFDVTGLPSSLKMTRIAGTGYLFMPGTGCIAGPDIGIDATAEFRPEVIVGKLDSAQLTDSHLLINDIVSHHYEFSEEALPLFKDLPLSVDGHVYVADDGAYVTRLELRAEGVGDLLGDGQIRDGVYLLELNINLADESIVVGPPLECTQDLPYPMIDDAQEITSIDELLSFKTPMPIVDVVDFYQFEMVELGWSEISEPALFDDLAILVFQRGADQVTVQIAAEPGENLISVFISP